MLVFNPNYQYCLFYSILYEYYKLAKKKKKQKKKGLENAVEKIKDNGDHFYCLLCS
jgi:hypothetical protein